MVRFACENTICHHDNPYMFMATLAQYTFILFPIYYYFILKHQLWSVEGQILILIPITITVNASPQSPAWPAKMCPHPHHTTSFRLAPTKIFPIQPTPDPHQSAPALHHHCLNLSPQDFSQHLPLTRTRHIYLYLMKRHYVSVAGIYQWHLLITSNQCQL